MSHWGQSLGFSSRSNEASSFQPSAISISAILSTTASVIREDRTRKSDPLVCSCEGESMKCQWRRSCLYLFLPCVLVSTSILLRGERRYFDVQGTDYFLNTNYIFVGKLVGKESYRGSDGRFIFTRHVFQVEEAIKGNPGSRVEITEYGGTVGKESMGVSHGPAYLLGQEYLVFCYMDLLGHNRTLAGPFGQFRLIADKTGRRMVRIPPSHPLCEVLDAGEAPLFQDVSALSKKLRELAVKLSHTKETGHAKR